jgi:glucosamine--fructose-6-phosphate aminotransferase (isomerizing)
LGLVAKNWETVVPWAASGNPLNSELISTLATTQRYQRTHIYARANAIFVTSHNDFVRKYDVSKIGKVMEAEIAEIPAVFQTLLDNPAQFSDLANLLNKSEIQSVLVLARGTSDNAAHFLKYLIETKLGLPVGLTSPSSVTIYKTKLNFKNTLVVAISQSGQSTDLIEYAKAAQISGALLVAMTNDESSPLAKSADFHITLLAGKELAVAATKSYAAQLLCSLLLVQTWLGDGATLTSIISEANRLVLDENLVTKAIAAANRDGEIVVLGRGFSYPNAREAALKIQETSKISVQGLSIADYMHGPISALTAMTQVFILAPKSFPLSSLKDDLAKIRSNSPKIFWIGSGELALPNEIVIDGAACQSEIFASIVDSIVLQRFALEFARKNGLDPDSPAGLSKVTLTI